LSVFSEYFEQKDFEQLVAGFEKGLNVQVEMICLPWNMSISFHALGLKQSY